MKEKILYSIVSLFIGACVGGTVVYAIDTNKIKEKEDEIMEIQSVLDEGRDAMIKTNIYVNEFAKKLFISSFVDGNTNAAVASKLPKFHGRRFLMRGKLPISSRSSSFRDRW